MLPVSSFFDCSNITNSRVLDYKSGFTKQVYLVAALNGHPVVILENGDHD